MKKNLQNMLFLKISLVTTGVLLSMISFAQTTINAGQTVNAVDIPANSNVTINAGGTLDMGGISKTFNNVTTSGNGNSMIIGAGTLTVSNTLTVGTNNTLSVASGLNTNNFNCNNGSTVAYNGGAQVVRSANYKNLTIAGTGTKTLGGDRDIAGNLLIENGATLSLGNDDLTINTNSATTTSINGNLNLNGSGRLLKSSFTNKTLSLGAGAVIDLSGIYNGNGQLLPVFGIYSFSPTSTVRYSASDDQNIDDVPSPGYGHLFISGSGNGDSKQAQGSLDIQGNLTIASGTFDASNGTHDVMGNWIRNGGVFITGSGRINFNGSGAQTIGGTQSTSFERITFSNTGAGITLLQATTVTVDATFTNGVVTSDANNLLIFNNNATSSLSATNSGSPSYVSGPVRKIGDNDFTFPVGKVGTGFVPIRIADLSGTGSTFTAEYIRATPPNRTVITAAGIQGISKCEYWELTRAAGTTTTADVTAYWNANSPCDEGPYVTQPSSMRLVHYNGTSWNAANTVNGQGNSTNGSAFWNNVNSFSPFALGTTNLAANPLPVVFDNVKAFEKNGGVHIEWSNLTEKDVVGYSVERSANGKDFSAIGEQAATSNQNDKADYAFFDASPANGAGYYRIKAVETTGKVVYSKVLSIVLGQSATGLKVYPNPVVGKQANISLNGIKNGQYNLRVTNSVGVDVARKVINTHGDNLTQVLELPSTIKPGIYTIVVTGENYRQSKIFIVQ